MYSTCKHLIFTESKTCKVDCLHRNEDQIWKVIKIYAVFKYCKYKRYSVYFDLH